jgi:DNA-binding NarL/FixJ family response regulator
MRKSLTAIVADNQPFFVEGLKSICKNSNNILDINIIGVVKTGTRLLAEIKDKTPELIIMDVNLSDTDTIKLISILKTDLPDTRILLLTDCEDSKLVKASFKAGVDGYMLKSGEIEEFFIGVETVLKGDTYLGRGVETSEKMSRNSSASYGILEEKFAKKHALTKREMEVLRYIGQAMNNKDISIKLYISDQTVSVHRKNIMRKLLVNNTANLMKIAYENNLV